MHSSLLCPHSTLPCIKFTFTIGLLVWNLMHARNVWPRSVLLISFQPRSQGLRGETVTKTLVKFVLSFQNFGEKIACAVRHNRIAISDCNTVEYGCVSLRMRFFSQNFGTIKWILPGSSSPSHREGPGTEVDFVLWFQSQSMQITFPKNSTFVREASYTLRLRVECNSNNRQWNGQPRYYYV